MASVVEEIPIESTPVAEVDVGAEEAVAQASAPPEPAAKKRGRPKGSKNIVTEPREPAPRAAEPAPKKKTRAAVAPPSSASEEEPPPPTGSLAAARSACHRSSR